MSDFWEGQVEKRAKCRKMVIFPGLKSRDFVPDTSEHPILHHFRSNSPPSNLKKHQKVQKLYFGQISNSSLIFYPFPLPILGLSFKFNYTPLSGHYRSYLSQNFVFKTYAYPKLSRKNLRGVDLPPPPPPPPVQEGLKFDFKQPRIS